jgi:cell division transport system ATP-binding protein
MAEETIIELINADIFQQEELVLKDVNLLIQPGEFIYVIGKVESH